MINASLYTLKRELNKYYNMRDVLNKVINYLVLSIEKIEPASSKIVNYSIDELVADQGAIVKSRNDLIAQRDKLSHRILPRINWQINMLKKKIQEEEIVAGLGV